MLLAVGAWAAPGYIVETLYQQAEEHARSRLLQLKGQIEAPMAFEDHESVRLELQKLGVDELEYAEVHSGGALFAALADHAEPPPVPATSGELPVLWRGEHGIHGALRFTSAAGEAVTLQVGFSTARISQAAEDLRQSALIGSLVVSGLFWLLLGWFGSRLVRPIERTTRLADAIAAGQLSRVVVPPLETLTATGDELARLERAFTGMVWELRDKRAALEQARSGLEAKVAAQTHALSAALLEARAASEAKSRFLANMSHEIRTPMNGVLGMARMLKETPLSHDQQEMVSIIKDTGQTLMGLLNQILDSSKIEAGHLALEAQPYDTRAAFGDVVSLFQASAQARGVALRLVVAGDVPRSLLGDPLRLRQIVGNLTSNALKFTTKGEVSVAVSYQAEALVVSVRDTGSGIPRERQQAIFGDFTQADISTSRTHGGTGLGLHICKQLVELAGGEIGVDSTPGVGSTFWFRIPQPRATLSDSTPPREEACVPPAAVRVLVVDDNRINLKVASRMLQHLGADVHTASGGQEAIDAALAEPYQLILMDCMMPEIDGFEATRSLRARGYEPPIVALTASAFEEDREACQQAGMDGVLTKPVMPEDLAAVLVRFAS